MISPQQEQGLAMLGPAHSLTGSSPGSRPDVSNPRTRSRTCASSNTFPLEPAIDAARSGHRIGSPSVGDARGVVKEVSDRMRPEIVGFMRGEGGLGGPGRLRSPTEGLVLVEPDSERSEGLDIDGRSPKS